MWRRFEVVFQNNIQFDASNRNRFIQTHTEYNVKVPVLAVKLYIFYKHDFKMLCLQHKH